jgi:hypothetical protein
MRFGRLGGAAIAAILLAEAASAAITQYECRFSQERSRSGGWIPEIIVVTENSATGEILAFDPVIQHFIGNPIPVRLSAETKARKTFTWEINTRNRGQAARMKYTLSYFTGTKAAKMRAQPGGYDNSWEQDGACKVTSP